MPANVPVEVLDPIVDANAFNDKYWQIDAFRVVNAIESMKRVDHLLVDLQFEAEYEFVTQSILNLTAYPQLLKIHLRGRILKALEEEPKDEEEAEEAGDRDLFGYDYSVKLWDVKMKELEN